MFIKQLIAPIVAAALLAALAGPAHSTSIVINHNFAPGDLEGWQQIVIPGGDPALDGIHFRATNNTFSNRMQWADPVGDVGGLTVTNAAGNADYRGAAHNSAILRSPTFTLNGIGAGATLASNMVTEISFALLGGTGTSTGPVNVSDIPASSLNQTSPSFPAYLGVGLRRTTDDAYLLWANRSGNGQSNFGSPLGFETFIWDEATLAAATAGDPAGTLYTLDLIDAGHGDWGWVSMENASFTVLPEPGVPALVAIGGLLTLLRRRR